jgi:hypothetical protein
MRTTERFNWLVLITFTTGVIIFILTQTIVSECGIMGDKLSLWRAQLDFGINTNWSGWDIDFEISMLWLSRIGRVGFTLVTTIGLLLLTLEQNPRHSRSYIVCF